MNEVVWVAMIGVAGTLVAALANPVMSMINTRSERRLQARRERTEAVEEWVKELPLWVNRRGYASTGGQSSIERDMTAATARLSGVLQRGEGPVREFAVGMMTTIDELPSGENPSDLVNRTSEILFGWARGDVKAGDMRRILNRYRVGGTVV